MLIDTRNLLSWCDSDYMNLSELRRRCTRVFAERLTTGV
jgi:hypothetical protein